MNLIQGIGLDPNGRNLIEMFGFILKNDTAREVFGKAFGLIRIDNGGMRKAHDKDTGFRILREGMLYGEMKIIRDHAYDHFQIVPHLAFQVIIVCTIYQKRNVGQAGARRGNPGLPGGGGVRGEEGGGG